MGNIFNDDFRDFISALNNAAVEYLLVGGYAVIIHGYRRTSGKAKKHLAFTKTWMILKS